VDTGSSIGFNVGAPGMAFIHVAKIWLLGFYFMFLPHEKAALLAKSF
jgi:hypothetical protein